MWSKRNTPDNTVKFNFWISKNSRRIDGLWLCAFLHHKNQPPHSLRRNVSAQGPILVGHYQCWALDYPNLSKKSYNKYILMMNNIMILFNGFNGSLHPCFHNWTTQPPYIFFQQNNKEGVFSYFYTFGGLKLCKAILTFTWTNLK